MLLIILLMSTFFILMGQVVHARNIGLLLKGNNDPSDSVVFRQKKESFLKVFRTFHVLLGVSFGILGLISHFNFGWRITLNIVVLAPLFAYIFFFYRYEHFFYPKMQRSNRLMILLIGGVFLMGGWLAFTAWGNNHLEIRRDHVLLRGFRGLTISYDQIAKVDTVYELPAINQKYLAHSLNTVPTIDGQMIHVVINPQVRPYLAIKLKNGKTIYYSSRFQSSAHLLIDMEQQLRPKSK